MLFPTPNRREDNYGRRPYPRQGKDPKQTTPTMTCVAERTGGGGATLRHGCAWACARRSGRTERHHPPAAERSFSREGVYFFFINAAAHTKRRNFRDSTRAPEPPGKRAAEPGVCAWDVRRDGGRGRPPAATTGRAHNLPSACKRPIQRGSLHDTTSVFFNGPPVFFFFTQPTPTL